MRNNLLNDKFAYSGDDKPTPTQLHLCSYSPEGVEELSSSNLDDIKPAIAKNRISWLQINGLLDANTVKAVCDCFGISFLTAQDILNTDHQPKLEDNGAYIVAIMRKYSNGSNPYDDLEESNIAVIMGSDFVLSFMEKETPYFNEVRNALKNNVFKIRERTSDYLFSVLLNSVIADYVSISMRIDDMLEDLGSELMIGNADKSTGTRLQSLRQQYIRLKHGIAPLRDQFGMFFRSENPIIHHTTHPFFSDVNDHLQLTFQTLEICRETLASLTDLYVANNDVRLNAIMKRLTLVSTIFIPLTFLVGVWGMNFKFMPELQWHYGYLYAWVVMVVVALVIAFYFQGKKWK